MIIKKEYAAIIIFVLFYTVTAANLSYAKGSMPSKITLGLGQTKETIVAKLLSRIYSEAFGRLGIEFEMQHYPAKRCSLMSDEGSTDGEAWRIYNYSDFHPRLVRVETPNIPIRFVAYVKKDSGIKKLRGWESLKTLVSQKIVINTRRGQIRTQEKLKKSGYTLGKNWQFINRIEPTLRKLLSDERRVDIYIDVDWLIEQVILENNLEGIYEAGVMEELETYLFLHEKHKALVPKIAGVLKQMHDEGLIADWVKQAKK